jgi:four helix bundle protein|tara:strand:+ start:215 stop:568 length:354 start_codon:yes stop_codon:yes gene_type:complete
MQNYINLEVYQEAEDLVSDIYNLTKKFPQTEIYNLISQMRRASTSICANIAEGTGRSSNADFLRFLHNSMGSLKELDSFIRISTKLNYISQTDSLTFSKQITKIGNRLGCLMKKLKL